jgi:DNA-binding MltR family transcriptional regulator
MTLSEKTHAGHAILSVIVIDRELKRAILTKMRPLSKIKEDRLFKGQHPLAEFAAKIDVAYALRVIDDDIYGDLRIINDIRNEFAHVLVDAHFRSPEVTIFLRKFKEWNEVIDPFALFGQKVGACLDHIKANADTAPKETPSA